MKRTFAKQGLMSLMAGFFLFGMLLLTATRSEAQTNWMQPDQAQLVLVSKLGNLATDINSLPPGSTPYTDALIHAYYYKGIYNRITEGMTVEQAAVDALRIFPDNIPAAQGLSKANYMQDVPFVVTKAKQGVLYADAQALLSN